MSSLSNKKFTLLQPNFKEKTPTTRFFASKARGQVFCVKIGKIFRQFSIKNADTSEQKSKFSKSF